MVASVFEKVASSSLFCILSKALPFTTFKTSSTVYLFSLVLTLFLMHSYKFSTVLNSFKTFIAVFGPIPATPGILSLGSPESPL